MSSHRISCLVICLSGPGHPVCLHSFPTRRSSDLTEQMMHPEKLLGEQKDDPQDVALDASAVAAALGKDWKALYSNVMGDRKSTRLNSSHLVISYAVFCLKKKKTAN